MPDTVLCLLLSFPHLFGDRFEVTVFDQSWGEPFVLFLIRRMFFLCLHSPPLSCGSFFPFLYTLTRTWQLTPEGIKEDGVGGTGKHTGLIRGSQQVKCMFLLPVSATLRRV